ncbi:hypothetical protein ACH9D2_09025 [Kocuria sp. M4R2S49]|uniref:hypothetical protein n=1 Tax=Kocuria rhizosphaericola TaxID=3376284 RepID=UPI0037969754
MSGSMRREALGMIEPLRRLSEADPETTWRRVKEVQHRTTTVIRAELPVIDPDRITSDKDVELTVVNDTLHLRATTKIPVTRH